MGKFDRYAFSAKPSFNEAETREAFSHAVPLQDTGDLLLRSEGS